MAWFDRFGACYTAEQARRFSPLQLAYLGDAVFDLYVRTHMFLRHDAPSGMLHRRSTGFVSAEAQARAFLRLERALSDEERNIARWGRNAHNPHSAKNANRQAYARATGLETLIGYLYLTGRDERLAQMMEAIVAGRDAVEEEPGDAAEDARAYVATDASDASDASDARDEKDGPREPVAARGADAATPS